jgi:SnoaL-like domain
MEQSDELRDLTLRFYEAATTGDLPFFERHVSRQEGAVFLGTDPNEWWEGFEAFVEAMRAQWDADRLWPTASLPGRQHRLGDRP